MSLLSSIAHRYQFPLLRIDDRLIHGQVVLGWAEPLRVRHLRLVHDEIARDAGLKDAICASVPSNLDFAVQTVVDAIPIINDPSVSRNMMIVVESPKAALDLWEQGAGLKSINIGGLHSCKNRIRLLPYVFMTDLELEQIACLARSGLDVWCQDLPSTSPVAWEKLMDKLDRS